MRARGSPLLSVFYTIHSGFIVIRKRCSRIFYNISHKLTHKYGKNQPKFSVLGIYWLVEVRVEFCEPRNWCQKIFNSTHVTICQFFLYFSVLWVVTFPSGINIGKSMNLWFSSLAIAAKFLNRCIYVWRYVWHLPYLTR